MVLYYGALYYSKYLLWDAWEQINMSLPPERLIRTIWNNGAQYGRRIGKGLKLALPFNFLPA